MDIIAHNIHKSYRTGRKEVRAVDGVELEVKSGEALAIVGPSGAGKSTLLHIIGGLDRPTHGKVILDMADIYRLSDAERSRIRNERIGLVFQFYHLLPEFTALENVMMPLLISRTKPGSRDAACEVLKAVGMSHRLSHKPGELSGGEAQRVAIARALVMRPDILLCDEPTGNLDSKNGEAILDLIFEVKSKSGISLVVVTHDEKISSRAKRTIHLKDGKIV
jgi:lipoprotein-releasing system ATP-binding protein